MSKMKDVYDYLEKSEDGKSMVDILKAEIRDRNTLEAEARTARSEMNAIKEQMDGLKPVLDILSKESITVDGLSAMVNKSREGESEMDKLRRDIETLGMKLEDSEKKRQEAEEARTAAKQETLNASLKDAFSRELEGLDPTYKNDHLELGITKGKFRMDENNQPLGEFDGSLVSPKVYAEKLRAQSPHLFKAADGAGSEPSRYDTNTSRYEGMSANNLIGEGLKARGL